MWEFLKDITGWLVAILTVLVGVIWKYNDSKHKDAADERDKLSDRIKEIEVDYIGSKTIIRIENDWRDEILRLREDHKAMLADRKAMHEENKAVFAEFRASSDRHFERIEEKIDENEKRDSQTRHDIRDSVQAIALQVATLTALNGKRSNHGEPR